MMSVHSAAVWTYLDLRKGINTASIIQPETNYAVVVVVGIQQTGKKIPLKNSTQWRDIWKKIKIKRFLLSNLDN